jgi:hypothetical protein
MIDELPLLPLTVGRVSDVLRQILVQEGVPTVDVADSTAGRFVLFDSSLGPAPALRPGQTAVDVDPIRFRFANDPFARLESKATCRTWWRVGRRQVCEEAAYVDRRRLRGEVTAELAARIERLGGVWLRIAPVPAPYRTAFNFRFDHDAYDHADFHAVMDAIAGHERATTHFVCASTHAGRRDALRRLDGCDVGSHGLYHNTYPTVDENRRNIARGIEALRALGHEPSGFAAPHGRYHTALAEAMATLGLTHSSEFSAAYDDWPFLPLGSDVLQIPIHPVCFGIVKEAALREAAGGGPAESIAAAQSAAADVTEYFLAAAEAKRAAREPLFFYGHPDGRLGRHPEILTHLFATVDAWPDVWQTNFTEFQRWWRERSAVRLVVHRRAGRLIVDADRLPVGRTCAVEWRHRDGIASAVLDRPRVELRRESAAHRLVTPPSPLQPVRNEPIGGWRERLLRAINWEYATPIEEIDATHWQGRVKRTLRRWKSRPR